MQFHRSHFIPCIIATLASLTLFGCVSHAVAPVTGSVVAHANPPATQPVVASSAPAAAFAETWWQSGRGNRNALLWHTEFDHVSSLAVAGDRVVVGGRRETSGLVKGQGCLFGLSKETGKVVWAVAHDDLPERVHDMAGSVCSAPFIDGDRVYYLSNCGELCCVGLADGRVIWMLDMPAKLGVFKTDPGDAGEMAPSPIVVGDAVYCVTGNGADWSHKVPAPDAPSFIAVEKLTGKVIWSSNAPGKDISYGQWSTPALATVDGAPRILFAGGDGALYGFEPTTGKQLWKVDCRDRLDKADRRPDFISAPPLVVGQTAFVSPALDIEGSIRHRRLLAIDLHTHSIRWAVSPEKFAGSMGSLAYSNGIICAAGRNGVVVGLDGDNGNVRWRRDLQSTGGITGGICLYKDRLYLVTDDRLLILSPATGETLNHCDAGNWGTPVVVDDRIYVLGIGEVSALRLPGK